MNDESGTYDARKLRGEREPRQRVALPITWSVGVALVGAAITWGALSQRTSDMERRIDSLSTDVRQLETVVGSHDTKIEVDRAQYAEIIRRLDDLNQKIERTK